MFSDDEQMYDDKGRDESDKYQDKGVEDEEGLKKLVDSGDEEEEDEDKKDDELEEDDESRLKDDKAKAGGSGEIWMIFLPFIPVLIERSYLSFHSLMFIFCLLICGVDECLHTFLVLTHLSWYLWTLFYLSHLFVVTVVTADYVV